MQPPVTWRAHVTHPSEGKHPGFGHRIEEDARFHVERDVAIPMRDGVKLYADIIRPKGAGPFPVILTYSPYGKHGLKKFLLSPASGVPQGSVSKYAVWEGPDPEYFVPHGYAVLNVDARGSWYSEGDLTVWSDQEAQDGYDDTGATPYVLRTPAEIESLFEGLEWVPPGFTSLPLWRPATGPDVSQIGGSVEPIDLYGGVARKR